MKVSTYVLLLLFGVAASFDCSFIAKSNCPVSFKEFSESEYLCNYYSKFAACISVANKRCSEHYNKEFSKKCQGMSHSKQDRVECLSVLFTTITALIFLHL
ncbi:uncharacterized protein LOC128250805 isoform X3 [Octopus bimaculoides]|uniref:uncharacterized protein LOC128250805 isoform X3 n=1 Tax=Octopus bimaculoides TaxID=37653 RepID=UPI0022E5DF76|nr:uncharacterized protein LOC128250805 isoform X3 [Octopus bimaculoides]